MRIGLLCVLCIFLACPGNRRGNNNNGDFKVVFIQDGIIQQVVGNEISLKKETFSMVFYFNQPDGIFINASLKEDSFNAVLLQKPLDELPGFKGVGHQEEPFNKNKSIYISDKFPNYWMYTNNTSHRFNKIDIKNNVYICQRTIENLTLDSEENKDKDKDKSKNVIELTEMKEKYLYLVILKLEWNQDFSKRLEKKRKYYRIKFK